LLRRPGASLGTTLEAGNLTLDTAERVVRVEDVRIDATPREVDLLESLLRRVGHVVAKPMLESALYSMDAMVTPNALEATVSRLRKRLSTAMANVQITTVHGVGYALFTQASPRA
jgi:DNA-binding response OmpR family regulator